MCVLFFLSRDVWPNTLNVSSLGKHAVSVSDWLLALWVCVCVLSLNLTCWLSSYTCICLFISCSFNIKKNNNDHLGTPSPFFNCVFLAGELGWGTVMGNDSLPPWPTIRVGPKRANPNVKTYWSIKDCLVCWSWKDRPHTAWATSLWMLFCTTLARFADCLLV